MKKIKLWLHLLLRAWRDAVSGMAFSHAGGPERKLAHTISVSQPFTHSATLEQKKHNLRLAAGRIARHTVRPGEVFSFWRAVGNPNSSQFKDSRSIIGGKLQIERGGGLCQASGIIYHLSLIAGLEIVERHNHSVDLYTEETRFCPLGSDATVSYGHKDLRVRNNTGATIRFELQVLEDEFVGQLLSDTPIESHHITFERESGRGGTLVARTIDHSLGKTIAVSTYQPLH